MTQEQERQPITEADISAFAQKLESWGQELPDAERAVLRLLLARAEASDFEVGDVCAFTLSNLTFSQYAFAALSPLAQVSRRAAGDAWVEAPIRQQKGGIQSYPGIRYR